MVSLGPYSKIFYQRLLVYFVLNIGGAGLNLVRGLIHRGSIISVDCVIRGDIWAWPLVSVVHLRRHMSQAVVIQTQTLAVSLYGCMYVMSQKVLSKSSTKSFTPYHPNKAGISHPSPNNLSRWRNSRNYNIISHESYEHSMYS